MDSISFVNFANFNVQLKIWHVKIFVKELVLRLSHGFWDKKQKTGLF